MDVTSVVAHGTAAKLAVGFPLTYHVPSLFFSHWLTMDQSQIVGSITVTGVYVVANMAMIVDKALSVDMWDRLVILEHDMLAPRDAFNRIAAYRPEHDIVGSMYFRRDPPHHANVLMQCDDLTFDPIDARQVKTWCDAPQLYEVHAVGFGLTSIARHVLEGWDENVDMFATDARFGSHDLWFCHHARAQGYRVFVDSAVVCEHLSELPVGLDDNQRFATKRTGNGKRKAGMAVPRSIIRQA